MAAKEPHQAVSAQTISKWIVKTIRMAYHNSALKVKKNSAHAIGPSWAIYNGASIRSILEVVDWNKQSTFIQFYFRNVDVVHLNLGRRFTRSGGSLSPPPGSLLATDRSKAVVLV